MQKYNKSKDKTYQNVEDGIFRKKRRHRGVVIID